MCNLFNENDRKLFKEKGIQEKNILEQLEIFKKGIAFLNIYSSANVPDGIHKFDDKTQKFLCGIYDSALENLSVLKFVPASGAASRMFKDLFSLREKVNAESTDTKYTQKINDFFNQLPYYGFYEELKNIMSKSNISLEDCISKMDFITITDYILNEKGLNYANTPKALIKFHRYKTFVRAAIEEHLVEAALYGSKEGISELHFTISPEHKKNIIAFIENIRPDYEKKYQTTFKITYSVQKPSTDTIAVDLNNQPFRETDGSLLFRPAGHGALIENLNGCKQEMIFVKNIDNIVPDRLKAPTVLYKKIIGGLLISLKDKLKEFMYVMEDENITLDKLNEIVKFSREELFILVDHALFKQKDKLLNYLKQKLNRPLRVCGMVVNEGEPGGGPFWVKDNETNEISLQIVESSQINLADKNQSAVLKSATHFNPVDLVCWVYDYKGNKFHLPDYVDARTGFISIKSKDGRELKALELPGLWNGAMADWITVFVETPLITFNPVKTIDDLLRKEHQAIE